MNHLNVLKAGRAIAAVVMMSAVYAPLAASAWEINVGNYGFAPTAMPFAVAMEEGFFTKHGVDITGIRNAPGGNAARLMVAGDLAYADGGLTEVIGGRQAGADLWIVSDNTHNAGGVSWVVMPDSPIKTSADIKGKRLSFTTPHSITEAWSHFIVDKLGFAPGDVELISAGGVSQGLTLLEHGGTDVAVIDLTTLAKNPGKYRVVLEGTDASIFPAQNGTVGYVTGKFRTEHPEVIQGIIAARREAVEFMKANPTKAAADIAKQYNADPALIEGIITHLADKGAVGDTAFYGLGNFDLAAMNNTVEMSKLVGAIEGDIDIKSMIDESFLPDDLKTPN
jgi:NitT/TauT family transport system substrate-binding protein